MIMSRVICSFLVFMFFLSSCSSAHKNGKTDISELGLYHKGINELKKGNYRTSKTNFEELVNLYPVSYWTTRAKINIGYIDYVLSKYPESIAVMDSLIVSNPASKQIEYAYYVRVNAYYVLVNDLERDNESANKALQASVEYMRLFPKGKYFDEVSSMNKFLIYHSKIKLFSSCRESLLSGYSLDAINCFKLLLSQKPKDIYNTQYIAESWYRLIEGYLALGLHDLASDAFVSMKKDSIIEKKYNFWTKRAETLLI